MKTSAENNVSRVPTCLAVHDLCTYAKSSLSVVIPVMEALGVEVCPLPTAVLSTQLDGFEDVFHRNLDHCAREISACLRREDIRFDCLYTGFLSTPKTAGLARSLRSLLVPGALVAVDPVLGDYGRLYSGFGSPMVGAVRRNLEGADVIKPNWTEGCLLTGVPYVADPEEAEVTMVLENLRSICTADIAMTDVPLRGVPSDRVMIACLSRDGDFRWLSHEREAHSLPGSGDFFCSVMVSAMLQGMPFFEAVEEAGRQTRLCIRLSLKAGYEHRHGISTALWTREKR